MAKWSLSVLGSLASLIALAATPVSAQPSLGYFSPSAVRPGATTDIAFLGGNLEAPTRVYSTFAADAQLPADIANNGTEAGRVVYRFNLPAETPLGIGAVRVASGKGVSEWRLIMVDDLATGSDNGNNKTRETAQELTLPIAVDGTCEPESFDYYRFAAHTGQRVSVEVVAQRLGTALDPVVRLLDSEGRELAYSDDEPGIGADSRFVFQFPADGQYLLEVRDIRYQGGGNHRYRLRVGEFPLVTVPFPLGVARGATAQLEALGPAADGTLPVVAAAATNAAADFLNLTVRWPGAGGGAFTTCAVSNQVEAVEFEPNDAPEQASPVELPAAINGRFAAAGDRDYYQFQGAKGQRFLFIGKTRSLGSPSDLFLRVFKSDGGLLAEVEDTGTDEGVLNFTCPEDGAYRLMVEDLVKRGGPDHGYRIEALAYAPAFALAVETDRLNPPQAGVAVLKVTCARLDYGGPINLSIDDAATGAPIPELSLAGQVIAENANETVIRVTLPAAWQAGHSQQVRVVGRARIGDRDFVAAAKNTTALRAQFFGLPQPPQAIDGQLALGVGPVFGDFFKLAVEPSPIVYSQLVGTATFNVKLEKLNGFDDAVALAVEGLPPGFTAEVKPIEKGKADSAIILKGPIAPAEGEFRISVVGSASFQEQPRSVRVADVVLRISKPLQVSLAPAGPLKAAATQVVKVRLARLAPNPVPVRLKFVNLPAGVTAPEGLTIAADQSELDVTLTAAADAAIGRFADVSVTAECDVQAKPIAAHAPAVELEVAMP